MWPSSIFWSTNQRHAVPDERAELCDGLAREERVEHTPERDVVGAIDLADPQWGQRFGTWDADLAVVVDSVVGVELVLVRERVDVACDLGDRGIARRHPEPPVARIPRRPGTDGADRQTSPARRG